MDLEALRSFELKPIIQSFNETDSILYALGLGYGADPTDLTQLQFVYEQDLKAVPSSCMVLAHPGFWISDPVLQIDWVKVLHGEQAFELARPIPPSGVVRGEYEVTAVEDKGEKGAVMHVAKHLYDHVTGELLARVTSVYMLRGDGGCGGFGEPPPAAAALPQREPDLVVDLPTLPQAALIYRLSGDRNPIHADPVAAARAGFSQPILHGLCSMGLATRAVIAAEGAHDPERLAGMSVRFSKPVYPGETLRFAFFREDDRLRFAARAVERDVVVLDRGVATFKN